MDGLVRAHDLLALAPRATLRDADGAPLALEGWARDSLARWPWAVVRRERHQADLFAVGVRGPLRGQRRGAWLWSGDVRAVLSPPDLVPRLGERTPAERAGRMLSGALRVVWGPTGSVGFSLASGAPVLRAAGDLDVMIELGVADDATVRGLADVVSRTAAASGCSIDCLLRTPSGSISLAELARGGPVMVRHEDGTVSLR